VKRLFLLMSMIACLCFSAVCPGMTVSASSAAPVAFTEQEYQVAAEAYMQQLMAFDDASIDSYLASGQLDEVTTATLESWKEMKEEVGAFVEITESDVTISDETVTVVVEAVFEDREGTFTLVSSLDMSVLESATFAKTLTLGEIFEKAALNTLMGMGTVFTVLILIAFIISLFKYIPKFQEMFAKKKNTAPAAAPAAPVAKAAPVVEEELVDDSELVAVIMAAIYASMASEGKAVSKDGLVVRSIRRSRR